MNAVPSVTVPDTAAKEVDEMMPTVNRFATLRLGYAALLLAAPDLLIQLSTGYPSDRAARAVTRLLGGRHLIQGILTISTPSTPMLAFGAGADVAHALSMLALAMLNRRRGRAELTDAAVAATLATAGAILATRARPVRFRADRHHDPLHQHARSLL